MAFVYQDAAIAIDPEANINNGQPSLHALCVGALHIRQGESVTHVGAGTGYYTAVLAKLAGPQGSVQAFEIEARLAKRAAENLVNARNVTIYERSGSEGELPMSDVIYVCAGATQPQHIWVDALRGNGRLLFPLTAMKGSGGMLLVKRTLSGTFEAKFLSGAVFIDCAGARDESAAEHLAGAFRRGNLSSVQSLRRNSAPDGTCWFAGQDWWLSSAPAV